MKEDSLAKRMLARQEAAYGEFCDRYGRRIFGYLRKRMPRHADAEELAISCVSDAAMRLHKGKYEEREDGTLDSFVFAITRNHLADWYKKLQDEPPSDVRALVVPDDVLEPDMEMVLAVDDAFPKLPLSYQQIITMVHFHEFEPSFKEVAAWLGIREDTARVRHHRALDRLESLLLQDARVQRKLSEPPRVQAL